MGASSIPLQGQLANIQSPSQVAGSVLGVQDLAAQVQMRQQQDQALALQNQETIRNQKAEEALKQLLMHPANQPVSPVAAPTPSIQPGTPNGQLTPGVVGVDQGTLAGATVAPPAPPTPSPTPTAPAASNIPYRYTDDFLQKVSSHPDIPTAMAAKIAQDSMAYRTHLATLKKDDLDNIGKLNNQAVALGTAYQTADPADRPAVWYKIATQAKASGIPNSEDLDPTKDPGLKQVQIWTNMHKLGSEAVKDVQEISKQKDENFKQAAKTIDDVASAADPQTAYPIWRSKQPFPDQFPNTWSPDVPDTIKKRALTADQAIKAPGEAAKSAQQVTAQHAQDLASATNKDDYTRIYNKIKPTERDPFDAPSKFDPNVTPSRTLRLGITPEQRATLEEADTRLSIAQQRADEQDRNLQRLISRQDNPKPVTKGQLDSVIKAKETAIATSRNKLDLDLTNPAIDKAEAYRRFGERAVDLQNAYEERLGNLTGNPIEHQDWADKLQRDIAQKNNPETTSTNPATKPVAAPIATAPKSAPAQTPPAPSAQQPTPIPPPKHNNQTHEPQQMGAFTKGQRVLGPDNKVRIITGFANGKIQTRPE